jgi:hypothetical protein
MMRTQKNWFKMSLMTLAAIGLMIGVFTFSAQADEQKGDDSTIVILYNQFEAGKYVKVKDLHLLCVPTHKEIYDGGGKQDDGQYEEPPKDGPKDEYKYDHLACYKVKDYDYKGTPEQKDDKKY